MLWSGTHAKRSECGCGIIDLNGDPERRFYGKAQTGIFEAQRRGAEGGTEIDRTKSDQIGMLATVMNCIYVSEVFRSEGLLTEIFTPFQVGTMTRLFSKDDANRAFAEGKVLFFAGGTGHPYFSTDTGIVLRAVEMEADEVLLAKNVDGVYDSDPAANPDAKRYDVVSIRELVEKKLDVIDHTASVMAEDNRLSFLVFDLRQENSIAKAISGNIDGTHVIGE